VRLDALVAILELVTAPGSNGPYRGHEDGLDRVEAVSAWSNTILLGDWKTSSLTSRPSSTPRLLDDLAPDVLGDRHRRPIRADGAAADIPLWLAVIGWRGASESSCPPCAR
jgi:hypothetical protein